jgi:hypothetical protein
MMVAILDDYQNAALGMADWSGESERTEMTVFTDDIVDVLGVSLGGRVAEKIRSGQTAAENQQL